MAFIRLVRTQPMTMHKVVNWRSEASAQGVELAVADQRHVHIQCGVYRLAALIEPGRTRRSAGRRGA